MLKNVINQILENHTKLKPSGESIRKKYYLDDTRDIEFSVEQEVNKVVIWAFKNSTDRFIKLNTNKYKSLIDGFKEVSENIKFKDNKVYITLVAKVTDNNNLIVNKIYGYARVSTKGQSKDGNSLEVQEQLLKDNGAAIIYKDAYTGTTTERPKFKELLEVLKEGDTLVVTKLDRIARSMTQGSELVTELINKGVRVNILNIGVMDNTPASKLIRNIFFSFAEFERDMIIERTQEGKAIAKQNPNFREGRPKKYNKKQLDHALSMLSVNGGTYSYNQVEEITEISKSTLIREMRKKRNDMKKIEKEKKV